RAKANTLVNLNTGLVLGSARLTLSVLNVFDEQHSDIQYFYRSRLAGEPIDGVGDVHFHPAEPRQVRLGVTWEF
ncbi:MAG: TonB-dependent receptor, partial [Gemmatimonadetes bacterium]|nr:TonB-dependent receptor [Gemmatimonadota bacterium]